MSEQMILLFKVMVIGGIVLGTVSLGLGLYYELFGARERRYLKHTKDREHLARKS